MKRFLKFISIIVLLGLITISPKTRNLIGTTLDYFSKFFLNTINKDNKEKWLIDKPKWLHKPEDFEIPSY